MLKQDRVNIIATIYNIFLTTLPIQLNQNRDTQFPFYNQIDILVA